MTSTAASINPASARVLIDLMVAEAAGRPCLVVVPGSAGQCSDELPDNVRVVDDLLIANTDSIDAVDVALVINLLSAMDKQAAFHRLSALRDRYARKIYVHETATAIELTEILSMGFEKCTDPKIVDACEGDCFVLDPDSASRLREWNTPDSWANPENFKRYRW